MRTLDLVTWHKQAVSVVRIILVVLICGRSIVFGGSDSAYKYKKALLAPLVIEGDFASIQLDKEIYLHTNEDLSDIRIVDSFHQEVPYHVSQSDSVTALPLISLSSESHSTEMVVETGRLPLKKLSFLVEEAYVESFALYGSDGQKWQLLRSGTLFAKNQAQLPVRVAIDLPISYRFAFMKIKLTHNDNPPLVSTVVGTALFHTLSFLHDNHQKYTLLYSNPNAQTPTYDIFTIFDKIPTLESPLWTLQEQIPVFTKEVLVQKRLHPTVWLFLCFFIVVIFLILFLLVGLQKVDDLHNEEVHF